MGNPRLEWRTANLDQTGYYDLLGQAFAGRHLYLPIDPSPELMALPDPWDPAKNQRYAVPDLVLYGGRYYLYHGPVPALLLFAPWKMITDRDLPHGFATLLFCFFGYLFSAATFMALLRSINARPPVWFFGLLLLVMGLCQGAPFLLQRVSVYEVAISGGYFSTSAGFWLLTRATTQGRIGVASAALAGVMLGLAVGCRPNLAFAGLFGGIALFWLLRRAHGAAAALRSRELMAFTIPFAACLLMIAAYNYARFDDPLEFGMRYEMAHATYFRPQPAIQNLMPGLYYLLACPPAFEPVFPFVRLVVRFPFDLSSSVLPKRYFLEPIVGAIVIWPLALLALVAPFLTRRWRKTSAAAWTIVGSMMFTAIACVVLVASLGLVSQRFEMDYQPELVLAACFALAAARPRVWWLVIAVPAIFYGIAANLAIGIEGPYGTFVQLHPRTYVRVARWFSPVERFRPMLDPQIAIEAAFGFPDDYAGTMPLVGAGRIGARYSLFATMIDNSRLRLTSFSANHSSQENAEVPLLPGAPNRLKLDYIPENHTIEIHWNGELVMRHAITALVTAPAQVTVGQDHTDFSPGTAHFQGNVKVRLKQINGIDYD
jgi:hypothetical protein